MSARLELKGIDVLMRNLTALVPATTEQAAGALYREGERIMTASKELVPVDTGALRASGMVSTPEIRGQIVEVTLGYGGPAVSYAVFVHENQVAMHPNGMAKYLERPIDGARYGFAERLAADIRPALGTGAAA